MRIGLNSWVRHWASSLPVQLLLLLPYKTRISRCSLHVTSVILDVNSTSVQIGRTQPGLMWTKPTTLAPYAHPPSTRCVPVRVLIDCGEMKASRVLIAGADAVFWMSDKRQTIQLDPRRSVSVECIGVVHTHCWNKRASLPEQAGSVSAGPSGSTRRSC